jgi:hypothetical protein
MTNSRIAAPEPPLLTFPPDAPGEAFDDELTDAFVGHPVSPRLANLSVNGELDGLLVRDLLDPLAFREKLRHVRLAGVCVHAEIVRHCEAHLRLAALEGVRIPDPDHLKRALGRLEARQSAALVARYGLDERPAATLVEAGNRLGVGKDRARQRILLGLYGLSRIWPEATETRAEASPRGRLADDVVKCRGGGIRILDAIPGSPMGFLPSR